MLLTRNSADTIYVNAPEICTESWLKYFKPHAIAMGINHVLLT